MSPKPQFIQLHSDGEDCPLYALDAEGGVWELVATPTRDPVTGMSTGVERYWKPLTAERRQVERSSVTPHSTHSPSLKPVSAVRPAVAPTEDSVSRARLRLRGE